MTRSCPPRRSNQDRNTARVIHAFGCYSNLFPLFFFPGTNNLRSGRACQPIPRKNFPTKSRLNLLAYASLSYWFLVGSPQRRLASLPGGDGSVGQREADSIQVGRNVPYQSAASVQVSRSYEVRSSSRFTATQRCNRAIGAFHVTQIPCGICVCIHICLPSCDLWLRPFLC